MSENTLTCHKRDAHYWKKKKKKVFPPIDPVRPELIKIDGYQANLKTLIRHTKNGHYTSVIKKDNTCSWYH